MFIFYTYWKNVILWVKKCLVVYNYKNSGNVFIYYITWFFIYIPYDKKNKY